MSEVRGPNKSVAEAPARMGEIDVARAAGTMIANNAQIASAPEARASAAGSQ